MTQILFFGDSIVYGAWDEEGGWPQRLRRFLDKKVINSNYEEYFITYNLGIDGDTSSGVLKRFDSEVGKRIPPEEESVFIFHIGDNDSLFDNKTKKFQIPKEIYEENLSEIFSKAKNYSEKIVFIGSFPVDESKTNPVSGVPNCSYKNEYLEEYRKIAKKVCAKHNCYFLNLSEKIDEEKWVKLLPDGIHPNTEGYEITFKIIKKFLIENKII